MSHDDDQNLTAYALGELDDVERAEVEARALGGPFDCDLSLRLDRLLVAEGNLARWLERRGRWAA